MPLPRIIDWDQLTTAEVDWVQAGATGVLQLAETIAPSTVSNTGQLYVKSSDPTKLFFKDGVGTETDLIASSGDVFKVGTPVNDQIGVWTGDGTLEGDSNFTWDGANGVLALASTFNGLYIINTSSGVVALSLDNTTGASYLQLRNQGMTSGARAFRIGPINDAMRIQAMGNGTSVGVTMLEIDILGGDAIFNSSVSLKEKAAASANVADYGQLWVKNTSPNQLWFTDDAGTDVQLGLGGGGDTLPIVDTTAVVKGSADDTKLVRIEADALTTSTTRVITMPDVDVTLATPTELTKLSNIEANADVTDTTNVTAAGALMDSEVDADIKTLTIAASSSISGSNTGDEPDANLTTKGIIEIATTTEVNTGTDDTRAVSPVGLTAWTGDTALVTVGTLSAGDATAIVDAATLTAAGKIEIATGTETNTGTDATRAVSPDGLDDWTGSGQIATVGTLSAGNADAVVTDASLTAKGKVELATIAETDTGTDAGRGVTPDGLQGSFRNLRFITFVLIPDGTDVAVDTTVGGDFTIPFAGVIVQDDSNKDYFAAYTDTAGTTGTMVVDVHKNGTTIMTTNKLDIETGEKDTTDATTQPDLTTTAISAGDILTFDIDATHGTAAKGLKITIAFRPT